MATTSKYLFIATMNVAPDRDALFHEIYDSEHVPFLGTVAGVNAIARFENKDLSAVVGENGPIKSAPNEPRYTAIYEIDGPEVLASDEWSQMVERGRWPSEVRPFTSDRRHLLLERLPSAGGDDARR
ncbi:MAG: hypothetical protein JST31_01380 [Actinobacteria bacterium]|nr:hypothetical protein [Actinomycetota bacterium]